MRTEIPLLQNVRVAAPCHASWDDMTPVQGERVRICEGCQKRVYTLSAMGQAEAEGLLRSHEGHLCVRYYRRQDGTILSSDCPVGLRAARRLVLTRVGVSVGLCLLLSVAIAGFRATNRTMGDVSTASAPHASANSERTVDGSVENTLAGVQTAQDEVGSVQVVIPSHMTMGLIAPSMQSTRPDPIKLNVDLEP